MDDNFNPLQNEIELEKLRIKAQRTLDKGKDKLSPSELYNYTHIAEHPTQLSQQLALTQKPSKSKQKNATTHLVNKGKK